ncbi:unnamed protein product [Prorocentrum cordatum]|uniref:Uncharacterized protein n=1 Tax=Prorocentrum cordatum TaxID=2364126 RepID=A0ABN9S378_9DINO|nr:unnamed protein product [Polarella glacialis]
MQIKDGRYATMISRQLTSSADATEEVDDEEVEAPDNDRLAKRAHVEVVRLLESLPDAKKAEVLMAVMTKFKGAMMKGKGKG